MPIAVEVVPPAQFAAWVASKGGHMAGATPPTPDSTAASPVSASNVAAPAAAAAPASSGTPANAQPTNAVATNQAATKQP
jgi:cytochrome c oxidase subunit 2